MEELRNSHALALAEAQDKIAELEVQAAKVAALEALSASLQEEKEDSANKVSELEIEILELRESQESFDEERELSLTKLEALRDDLAAATARRRKLIAMFMQRKQNTHPARKQSRKSMKMLSKLLAKNSPKFLPNLIL